MFAASPIESWEGATAYFSYAGGSGVYLWLLVALALCVGTIVASIVAENRAEAMASEHVKDNGGQGQS